jgi:hypothetical protein
MKATDEPGQCTPAPRAVVVALDPRVGEWCRSRRSLPEFHVDGIHLDGIGG